MEKQKIDLIRQALSAAESSIKLSRQLLSDLERETEKYPKEQQEKSLPGVLGTFDGKEMITEAGEKHEVPENYASKSILVVGDTLKIVTDGGEKRFKQIEHVKRYKTTGVVTKKDGKWAVVTPEGSYKVLGASVEHFGGDAGDEALVQIPAKNLQVPWAAVEKITKKEDKGEVKPEKGPEEKSKKVESKKEETPTSLKSAQTEKSKDLEKRQIIAKEKPQESVKEKSGEITRENTKQQTPVVETKKPEIGEKAKEEKAPKAEPEAKTPEEPKLQVDEEELS